MAVLISLVIPVYNTNSLWFKECLDSILNQTYTNWELLLLNNGSESYIQNIIEEYLEKDDRIKAWSTVSNLGGANGINILLSKVTGQYVALPDSDDKLLPSTLERISNYINLFPHCKILYTDELIINSEPMPFYKPDYNAELLCFVSYFGHLTTYNTKLIKYLRLRHSGGSYDYDLALRASRIVELNSIIHIPELLYEYKIYPTSTSHIERQSCIDGGLSALQAHRDHISFNNKVCIEKDHYQVYLENGTKLSLNKDQILRTCAVDNTIKPHLLQYILENIE